MKTLALCALLVLSACTSSSPQALSATPSTEALAIETTKEFWKIFGSVLASGEIEPLAVACEPASRAWASVTAALIENREKRALTIVSNYRLKDFSVRTNGMTATVTHRLDWKLQDVSTATRQSLGPERAFAYRSALQLERFGARLLVTDFDLEPWG